MLIFPQQESETKGKWNVLFINKENHDYPVRILDASVSWENIFWLKLCGNDYS